MSRCDPNARKKTTADANGSGGLPNLGLLSSLPKGEDLCAFAENGIVAVLRGGLIIVMLVAIADL